MDGKSKKNSIKKNIVFQAIYELLILILPLITSPYIARVIGAEGLGIYSYTYSVAYYFVIFANLGIQNYGNRAIAKCRDNKADRCRIFSEIFTVHTITTIFCIVLYCIYIFLNRENEKFILIQGIYVIGTLFDVSWFYFGLEKFDYTVIVNGLTKIATVILIFTLVKTKNDLAKYCLILALGTFVGQLALWLPIKKHVDFVKITFNGLAQHIKPLVILFIPAIAVSLYKYMDKIMLGELSTKVELGFYDNSEKMINIPSTVISAVGTVMLPRMSNLVTTENDKTSRKYIDISMRYVMALAFGLSFGLAGISRIFSVVFWGNEFSECTILIRGLSLSIPFFSFANIIRTQYLIPHEKDREYLISIVLGAVVNLIVNATLIPRMSAMGAVIGTVVAEATVCITQACFTVSELQIKKYVAEIMPYCIGGVLMSVVVNKIGYVCGYSVQSLLLQVVLGGCLYITIVFGVLMFYRDQFLLNLLTKMRKGNKNV